MDAPVSLDPDLSTLAMDAAVEALRRLVLASQEFRHSFADYVGVGVTDTIAMSHLAAAGTLTTGELAERVGLAPSGATTMVDRLERVGLAVRTTRPSNRRTVDIALTARGVDALELSAHWTRQALLDVGADRLPDVISLLGALHQALTTRAREFEVARLEDDDQLRDLPVGGLSPTPK